MDQNLKRRINKNLINWYKKNARDLPWRKSKDPYHIWVSEIMLQQTRVDTVIPYYLRWLERFPTLEDLASASQDEVLSLWEGLGYYRRAINLHKAVKEVKNLYHNQVPKEAKTLQKLPGIGRYTAGAISSIAFDQFEAILDGNVRRVLTRLFNINTPLNETHTEKKLWSLAEDLIPEDQPGQFNQALMELGALVCIPNNPNCADCPLNQECTAKRLGLQMQLPKKKLKPAIPHHQVTAAVFQRDGNVFLARRPLGGLLGGMWEYPGGKQKPDETLQGALEREIYEELNSNIFVGDLLGVFSHAYTHYKVTLHAFFCQLTSEEFILNYHLDYAWVPLSQLENYPMGKIDRMISERLLSNSKQ
jgi:A/G-specific adenine glycosylase